MAKNNEIFQVAIVGSGPAGLSAGAHAAVSRLSENRQNPDLIHRAEGPRPFDF